MLSLSNLQRGVTLIEIMIGITIVGMLLGLGVPTFGTYMQNTRIRNAADAIQNGLTLARAEAVRRNTIVNFVLTGTDSSWIVGCNAPSSGHVADGVADCPNTTAADNIQARPASGSTGVSVATVPGTATTLSFNGVGRLSTDLAGASATFNISNPSGGTCAASGKMRCLRIIVTQGGQVRMCDPALSTSANPPDPRAC